MTWSLVHRTTGERRYYASGGFAGMAQRRLGASKWQMHRGDLPVDPPQLVHIIKPVAVAPPAPPKVPSPPYRLLNCLGLFGVVVGTKRARDWAKSKAKAAALYDHRNEDTLPHTQ
jgi:hypothetical protein